MTTNLFDYFKDMNVFGASPNAQVRSLLDSGLINEDAIEAARKRSIGTGIVTAVASYLAQPKNKGYGSALPYLAKSYGLAHQSAQAPFQGITDKYLMDTKLTEQKRVLDQRGRTKEVLEQMILQQPDLAYLRNAPDAQVLSAINEFTKLKMTPATTTKDVKFRSKEQDIVIDGVVTEKGIPKITKETRRITTQELNNNIYGKLPAMVNGRQAIWYLINDVPVNINKTEKALVENTISNKGDNAADSNLALGIAGLVQKNFTAAEAALMSNNSLDDLIGLTNEGVYAGRGSEIKLGLVEYGIQFGFIKPDEQEAVKAMGTKAVLQIIAQQQLDEAKANRGQGTLSDAERAIMSDARLGRIDTTNKEQLAMLAHTLKKLNAYKVVYHFDRLKAARSSLPESDTRLNFYSQIGQYNEGNIDELRQVLTRKAKLQTIDGKQQFVVNDEVQNLDVSKNPAISGGRFLGFSN